MTAPRWWVALPSLWKAVSAAIGLGGLVGATVAFTLPIIAAPSDISAVEVRVGALEVDLTSFTTVAFCRWQAEDEGMDPSICRRLMPGNFLPDVP